MATSDLTVKIRVDTSEAEKTLARFLPLHERALRAIGRRFRRHRV